MRFLLLLLLVLAPVRLATPQPVAPLPSTAAPLDVPFDLLPSDDLQRQPVPAGPAGEGVLLHLAGPHATLRLYPGSVDGSPAVTLRTALWQHVVGSRDWPQTFTSGWPPWRSGRVGHFSLQPGSGSLHFVSWRSSGRAWLVVVEHDRADLSTDDLLALLSVLVPRDPLEPVGEALRPTAAGADWFTDGDRYVDLRLGFALAAPAPWTLHPGPFPSGPPHEAIAALRLGSWADVAYVRLDRSGPTPTPVLVPAPHLAEALEGTFSILSEDELAAERAHHAELLASGFDRRDWFGIAQAWRGGTWRWPSRGLRWTPPTDDWRVAPPDAARSRTGGALAAQHLPTGAWFTARLLEPAEPPGNLMEMLLGLLPSTPRTDAADTVGDVRVSNASSRPPRRDRNRERKDGSTSLRTWIQDLYAAVESVRLPDGRIIAWGAVVPGTDKASVALATSALAAFVHGPPAPALTDTGWSSPLLGVAFERPQAASTCTAQQRSKGYGDHAEQVLCSTPSEQVAVLVLGAPRSPLPPGQAQSLIRSVEDALPDPGAGWTRQSVHLQDGRRSVLVVWQGADPTTFQRLRDSVRFE